MIEVNYSLSEKTLNYLTRDIWDMVDPLFHMPFKKHRFDVSAAINEGLEILQDVKVDTLVVGVSGGMDSAICLKLAKMSGKKVIPVWIGHRNDPKDSKRAAKLCKKLGLVLLRRRIYDSAVATMEKTVTGTGRYGPKCDKELRANIVARIRMMTLYHIAKVNNGCVVDTTNLSEKMSGFWTLHGDVGDVAPIQYLLKSIELPLMAQHLELEEFISLEPDGGLSLGKDETQLGFTYLELDAFLLHTAKNQKIIRRCGIADMSFFIHSQPDGRVDNATWRKILQHVESKSYKRL